MTESKGVPIVKRRSSVYGWVGLFCIDPTQPLLKTAAAAIEAHIKGLLPSNLAYAPTRNGDPSGIVLDYVMVWDYRRPPSLCDELDLRREIQVADRIIAQGHHPMFAVLYPYDLMQWIMKEADRVARGYHPMIAEGPFWDVLLQGMFQVRCQQFHERLFQRCHPEIQARLIRLGCYTAP